MHYLQGINLATLPEVPGPNREPDTFWTFFSSGFQVQFQLVNCTSAPIDILTYNQSDIGSVIPYAAIPYARWVGVPPGRVANCFAEAKKRPFYFLFKINFGNIHIGMEATRYFAVQVRAPRKGK